VRTQNKHCESSFLREAGMTTIEKGNDKAPWFSQVSEGKKWCVLFVCEMSPRLNVALDLLIHMG